MPLGRFTILKASLKFGERGRCIVFSPCAFTPNPLVLTSPVMRWQILVSLQAFLSSSRFRACRQPGKSARSNACIIETQSTGCSDDAHTLLQIAAKKSDSIVGTGQDAFSCILSPPTTDNVRVQNSHKTALNPTASVALVRVQTASRRRGVRVHRPHIATPASMHTRVHRGGERPAASPGIPAHMVSNATSGAAASPRTSGTCRVSSPDGM